MSSKRRARMTCFPFSTPTLKAVVCGCETWSPMKAEGNLLEVTEKVVEIKMLGMSLLRHAKNQTICLNECHEDIVVATRES